MTRGRTGSTAIIDELSKVSGVLSAPHELFLKMDFTSLLEEHPKSLIKYYGVMVPYELWKTKSLWFLRKIRKHYFDKKLIHTYLSGVERAASRRGMSVVGFKVLSNQFEETPLLKEVLIEHGYCAIYLKRNIPRQVISGMIAKQRGVYNTDKKFQDDKRYIIDTEEFKSLVEWEVQSVERDIQFLKAAGFTFIEVTYEEFMSDRQAFFRRVLGFLDVPPELPQTSSYSVMIKDLKHTVENYQSLVECTAAMGMRIE